MVFKCFFLPTLPLAPPHIYSDGVWYLVSEILMKYYKKGMQKGKEKKVITMSREEEKKS